MEIKMRRTIITMLGAMLIAGSSVQMAAASTRHHHRAPAVESQQFRNANDFVDGGARTFCSTEPGNPYNPQTDYQGWSAWRQLGAWDSRNDCD
jgi:hypothetical protein